MLLAGGAPGILVNTPSLFLVVLSYTSSMLCFQHGKLPLTNWPRFISGTYWDGGLGLGLGLDNNQSINHQHRQHRTGQFTFHYIHNCLKYASFISNMYLVENNLFARLKAYSFNIPVILEVNLILSDSS